ncbi:MAG: protein rep [Planctomycetota bacterium]
MASKRTRRKARDKKSDQHTDIFCDPRLKAARDRVVGILRTDKRLHKNGDALARCGLWPAALKLSPSGCQAVYRNQCREPLCPVCSTLKGSRHRAALVGVIEERLQADARFTLMTLTIRHHAGDKLKDLIRILFEALKKLRNTAFFKKHVRGWARGIEVTWNETNGFHPHAHYIVEGAYMGLDALHETWAECVRKVGGLGVSREGIDLKGLASGQGLNEAIGYPFKVRDLATWPEAKVLELAKATKRRHLYQACRKWSGRIKQREVELESLHSCDNESHVVLFRNYIEEVRSGEFEACEAAQSVLALLCAAGGLEDAVQVLLSAAPQNMRRSWSVE